MLFVGLKNKNKAIARFTPKTAFCMDGHFGHVIKSHAFVNPMTIKVRNCSKLLL